MAEPTHPALRAQLLEMLARDQAARDAWSAEYASLDPASRAERWQPIAALDRAHTAALKAIIAAHGWPGISLVGRAAANAAWLIAQHADHDPAFQRAVLAILEPLIDTGEIEPAHYAYLFDRLAVAEGRPQRFATQFDDASQPQPIEDAAHVDARRAAVGLEPLADYAARIRRLNAPKP